MKILKTIDNNKITFYIEGPLDTSTAPDLESALNEVLNGSRVDLIIVFSKLDYISSAGLRVLLGAQKKTNEVVGSLTIKHVSPTVMEVFNMTGFSDFLTIDNR